MAQPNPSVSVSLAEKPASNTSGTKTVAKGKKTASYQSDGVDDNDPFMLPVSDYQIAFVLTALAAVVRLFRIYQPSSVVFDEVQYVPSLSLLQVASLSKDDNRLTVPLFVASVASRRNTSRANSSWTYTRLWPRCL